MSQIFKPIVYCRVKASPKHNNTAKYFVALGIEDWDEDDKNLVIKVQMEYDGKRRGRSVPSYPVTQSNICSSDWDNVCQAVNLIREAYKNGITGEIEWEKTVS